MLCAAPPFEDPQLFYWAREARNANAEVDFVISRRQDILPVEVKAGKTGTLRSLFQFLAEKKRQRAVRFHLRPPALEDLELPGEKGRTVQLLSLPLYRNFQRVLGPKRDGGQRSPSRGSRAMGGSACS